MKQVLVCFNDCEAKAKINVVLYMYKYLCFGLCADFVYPNLMGICDCGIFTYQHPLDEVITVAIYSIMLINFQPSLLQSISLVWNYSLDRHNRNGCQDHLEQGFLLSKWS